MATLTLHTPTHRSPLSNPLLSPPHSPLSPLHPTTSHHHTSLPTSHHPLSAHPPSTPLPWLWQCHVCARSYPLGVTRRCLDDGHLFCSGIPASTAQGLPPHCSSSRKQRRSKGTPCASEFDYSGWTRWNEWRVERCETNTVTGSIAKNCQWECGYPSECRWSRVAAKEAAEKEKRRGRKKGAATSFEEILARSTSFWRGPAGQSAAVSSEFEEDEEESDEGEDGGDVVERDEEQDSTEPTSPLHYRREYGDGDGKSRGKSKRWRRGLW